jgi:tellurite resistance protein TehA-like permease
MSCDKCCGYSLGEINESFYFKRDSSAIWSKICSVISVICLIAFAIFFVFNLINNPNYSLIDDTVTISQISFVTGTLLSGFVFGASSAYLHGRFKKYDYLIQQNTR